MTDDEAVRVLTALAGDRTFLWAREGVRVYRRSYPVGGPNSANPGHEGRGVITRRSTSPGGGVLLTFRWEAGARGFFGTQLDTDYLAECAERDGDVFRPDDEGERP